MGLESLTKEAVRRFLSTVLIVDERAGYPEEEITRLHTPGITGVTKEAKEEEESEVPTDPPVDVDDLVTAFAQRGMFATPFKPADIEAPQLVAQVGPLAEKADVLVLDWRLFTDDGERAMAIAERVMAIDNRVRLVVFYTGRELDHVEESLVARFDLPAFEDGRSSQGSLRVAVLAKGDSTVVEPDDPRKVSLADLPERLIDLFADELRGLLPTVALAGLADVRANTHRVLTRMDRGLDPGFLGHRALLHDPMEAADHLPALLADELLSVVAHSEMTTAVQQEYVEKWLQEREADYAGYPTEYGGSDGRTGLSWMLAVHRSNWDNLPGQFKAALNDAPAGLHVPGASPEGDDRWADLMALRTFYGDSVPFLTLGTLIVNKSGTPEYLMCLQPACDSVRLSGIVPFPFMRLEPSTDRFDIVVMHDDEGVRLKVPRRGRQMKMLKFKASDAGVVRAKRREGGVFSFRSSGRVSFKWIGELKMIIGQRFAHEMATHMSRVGVDESEWLRLKSSGRQRRS